MQLQFDPVGFIKSLEKLLPQWDVEEHHHGNDTPNSFVSRVWRWGRRQWLGSSRWKKIQGKEYLVTVLRRLDQASRSDGKPSVAYVVPYDVMRMQTGGGKRIAGIAKALSATYRVYILSLSPSARPLSLREIFTDVWMVAIPTSLEFEGQIQKRVETCGGAAPLFAFSENMNLLTDFETILQSLAPKMSAWMVVSPFAWPPLQPYVRSASQVVVYDAHDELPDFLRTGLRCTQPEALAQADCLEGTILDQVTISAFCTTEDAEAACHRHASMSACRVVVPNGVDMAGCQWTPPVQVLENRTALNLKKPIVLFAGSNYKPNHEAVEQIVGELAPVFPKALFVIMGMHLDRFRSFGGGEPGRNVVFTGPVEEAVKEAIFSLTDVAIAPMKSGTGSSLKIPDYIAHGKIVLGTPIGLRGFEAFSCFNSVRISADICSTLKEVLEAVDSNPDDFTSACRAARDEVKKTLDWPEAARPLLDQIERVKGGV